jgi:hypothetical protein
MHELDADRPRDMDGAPRRSPTTAGDGYRISPRNWLTGEDGTTLVPGPRGATPGPWIVFEPPLADRFRVDLDLVAAGMEALRLRCRGKNAGRLVRRDVFVDVARPPALHHELDRVALDASRGEGGIRLRLELNGSLAQGESLGEIALDPVSEWLAEAPATPGMALRIDGVTVLPPRPDAPRAPFAASRRDDAPLPDKRQRGRRDAVLFAWWVPDNPEARRVGEYYLGLLRYHHPDSRIFLGVNHGSEPTLVEAATAMGLDIQICPVAPEIAVNSDVGGFLAALEGFYRSPERFDLVWFGHTKGASQPRYADYRLLRYWQERGFWARRDAVEERFRDPTIGLWTMNYNLTPTYPFPRPWQGWDDELAALQRIYRDRFPPVGLNALDTFFVLRAEIVRAFCDAVGDGFFRLDPHEYGASRWFFEMAFPSIASMQGYEPFIDTDVPGANDPRDDLLVDGDVKQNHRLAREEVRRWREDPASFRPRVLAWNRPAWQQ